MVLTPEQVPEMTIKGDLVPGSARSAMDTTFGAPFSEMALEMTVGPCVRCGRPPQEYEGGMLENVTVVDGVLSGDNVCEDCARLEDPDFNLDEVYE